MTTITIKTVHSHLNLLSPLLMTHRANCRLAQVQVLQDPAAEDLLLGRLRSHGHVGGRAGVRASAPGCTGSGTYHECNFSSVISSCVVMDSFIY